MVLREVARIFCDGCVRTLTDFTLAKVRRLAKEQGWKRERKPNADYCDQCRRERDDGAD